jgi:hypothetical protein
MKTLTSIEQVVFNNAWDMLTDYLYDLEDIMDKKANIDEIKIFIASQFGIDQKNIPPYYRQDNC